MGGSRVVQPPKNMVLQPILHQILPIELQHRRPQEQIRTFDKQLNTKVQQ